jgi:hypothetical protein
MTSMYVTYRNGLMKAFGFMKGNSMTPGVPDDLTIEQAIDLTPKIGVVVHTPWGWVKRVSSDLGHDVYIVTLKKDVE